VKLRTIAAIATVALIASFGLARHDRALATEAYVLLLCSLALIWLVRQIGAGLPVAPRLLRPRRRPPAPEPAAVAQLEWLERRLAVGADSALELHVTLRPLVTQVASAALARRHGVVLERQPERARELFGPTVWALVGEERPLPRGHAPGLSEDELVRLVDELEAI
jgi:hypothetical protein